MLRSEWFRGDGYVAIGVRGLNAKRNRGVHFKAETTTVTLFNGQHDRAIQSTGRCVCRAF